jgi:hypothetical protein
MGSVPTPNQPNFELETQDSGINSACLKFEAPIYSSSLDGEMYVINENDGTPIVEAAFVVNLNHQYLALINYPPYADLPTAITPSSTTVSPVLFGSTYCISYRLKLQNTYHIVLKIGSNVYKSNSAYLNSFGVNLSAGGITGQQNSSTNGMDLDFTIPPSNTLSNSWQVHITGVPAASQQQNSGPLTQAIFNLTTSLNRSTDPFNIRITNKLPISDPYTAIDVTSYSGTIINFCLLDGYVYTICVNGGGTLLSSNPVLMESPKIDISQITPVDVTLDFDIYCVGSSIGQLAVGNDGYGDGGTFTAFPVGRNVGDALVYLSKRQVNLFAGDNYTLLKTFPVRFKLIEGALYNVSDRLTVQAGLNKWRIISKTFDVDPYANSSEPLEASDQADAINTIFYPLADGVKYKITITQIGPSVVMTDLFNGQPEYTYKTRPGVINFNIPNLGTINYATSTVLLRLYQNNTNSTALAAFKIQPGAQIEPWQIAIVSPASTGTIISSYPDDSIINYPLFGGNTYIITISVYPGQVRSSLDFRLPTIEYVSNSFQYAGIPALITSPTTNPFVVNVKDGEPGNSILSVSGFSYGTVQSIDWARNEAPAVSLSTTVSLPPRFSSTTRRNNSNNAFIIGDEGTYVCTITDSFGYSKASFTVTVTPAAPVFFGDISSQGGLLSGTGTIYTFTAPPISTGRSLPTTYVWTFKANGASTATVISTKVGDGTCPITLNRATSLGVYTVTATNSLGSSAPVSTSITGVGDRPVVTNILSQIVTVGSTVCLENKQPDTVFPPPTFRWLLNGNEIYGVTGSFYNIYELAAPNAGKYDCVATNPFGTAVSVASILNVFKTSNSGLGTIETYSSGRGYSVPPHLQVYGSGGGAALKYPAVDKLYIRRVRLTGGNFVFTSQNVSVNAVGYPDAVLTPILTKSTTDWYISDAPKPSALGDRMVYQPIVITVNGPPGATGAKILPILDDKSISTSYQQTGKVIIGYGEPTVLRMRETTYLEGLTGDGSGARPLLWRGDAITSATATRGIGNSTDMIVNFAPKPIYSEGTTGYSVTGGGIIAAFQWNTGPNVSRVNLLYTSTIRQPQDAPPVYVSPQYIGDNSAVQGPILNSTKVKVCVLAWSSAANAGAQPGADVCPPPNCIVRVVSANPQTPFMKLMGIAASRPSIPAVVEVTWKDITWEMDGYRNRTRTVNYGTVLPNNARLYEPQIKIINPGNGYTSQPVLQLLFFQDGSYKRWEGTGLMHPDGNDKHWCAKAWYYCDLANNVNVTLSPAICSIQTETTTVTSTSGSPLVDFVQGIIGIPAASGLNMQGTYDGLKNDIKQLSDYRAWLRTKDRQEYQHLEKPNPTELVQYYMSLGGGLVDLSNVDNDDTNTNTSGYTVGSAVATTLAASLYGINSTTLKSISAAAQGQLALITPELAGSAGSAAQVAREAIEAITIAQNSFSYAGMTINNPLTVLGASMEASQTVIAATQAEFRRAQAAFEASGVDVSLTYNTYIGSRTLVASRITELANYFKAQQLESTVIFKSYTKSIADFEQAITNLRNAITARLPPLLQAIERAGMVTATEELIKQRALILSEGDGLVGIAVDALNDAKKAFIAAGDGAAQCSKDFLKQLIAAGATPEVSAAARAGLNVLESNPKAFVNNIDAIENLLKTAGSGANSLLGEGSVAGQVDNVIWKTICPNITVSESEISQYSFVQKYTKAFAESWRVQEATALSSFEKAQQARSEASNAVKLLGNTLDGLEATAARQAAQAALASQRTTAVAGRAARLATNATAANAIAASAIGARVASTALGAVRAVVNIGFLIAGGIGLTMSIMSYFTDTAVPVPDVTISYWMSDFILPFAPGSILISPGVKVDSLLVAEPGTGYSPGASVTIKTGGIAVNSPYFQGSTTTTAETFTGPLTVKRTENYWVLTDIAIESQGNGFTGPPRIGITGPGGDGTATAVADMSCSALGPLSTSTNNFYINPPSVKISPGTDPVNTATAKTVLNTTRPGSGSILDITLRNRETNVLKFEGGYNPNNPLYSGMNASNIGTYLQQWFEISIEHPYAPATQSRVATGRVTEASLVIQTPLSNSYLRITKCQIVDTGAGYPQKPDMFIRVTTAGRQVLSTLTAYYPSAFTVADWRISKILITDNGLGYDEIPKTNRLLDYRTNNDTGAVVTGSTGYASNFTSSIQSHGTLFPAACGTSIVPDYFIQNFTVVSGGTGYTGPPEIGITGQAKSLTNVIDSATVVSTTNTAQGVSIAVGSGGYYEFEPFSEFGSTESTSGLNIQIVPASNDTIADSQAYAIPIMNGRIIDCTNGIGVACYGIPLSQLPYTPAGINVTIDSVDGNGSGALITVSKYHYSFDLNAYIIDNFTITNAGSNYTTSPLITVTFVDSNSKSLATTSFYPRIGGPIASVKVVNSSVGFQYTPTTRLLPYGQTENVGGSYAPATLTVNWTQLTRGSVSTVYLTNQTSYGYTGPPEVKLYDTPRLGGNNAVVTANMGLFYLRITGLYGGLNYTRPPTVVFTSPSGLGGGAVAKAVLGDNGAVTKVIFATYGGGWINEYIELSFVPHLLDDPSKITKAYGNCIPVFSSLNGPPKVIAQSIDGNGRGAKFNVNVNTGLYLTGATGYMPFIDGILDVPNTVSGIAAGAFGNQKYITDLVFTEPSECFEIGNYAFAGCTGLRSAYIPKSVERIGKGAFHNCRNLRIVQFEGRTGPAFGTNAFLGCTGVHFYLTGGATSVVSSYGGGTGWVGLSTSNHLGTQVGLTGITGPNYNILANKPQGILGFTPLKQAIIPISDSPGTNFSVACDKEGNVYWNNTTLNVIQKVDVDGNQTVFSNALYPVKSLTIIGETENMYVVTSANDNIYQIPLTASPTWTAVCSIPSGYLIASDSAANVYVVSSSTYKIHYFATAADNPANDFIPDVYVTLPTSTILSSMCGGHFGNDGLAQSEGRIAAGVTIAINALRVILSYSSPDVSGEPLLVATGLHATSGLAYDNAGNLYSGSTASTLRGITKISSDGYHIFPYAPGFSTAGGIATSPRGFIFFSDGSNLCQLPIAITSVSRQVTTSLMSHDYATITAIIPPNTRLTLQPSDIASINSTLPPGSQAQTPITDPVTYVSPSSDGSVSLSESSTPGQVTYASSFRAGVPTTITIGSYPPNIVTYNATNPPTLTIQNNGNNSRNAFNVNTNLTPPAQGPFTISPGQEFTFAIGSVGLTLYSLGLTVFTITEDSPSFIPGVRGTPPPVCKPKKQGMDYSQYLSSNVQNAEYLPYKEKTIDASEWIRRKRMTSSVKFGSC